MLLAELVQTAGEVAATSSRTAKRDHLSELLRRLAPEEVVVAVAFLIGETRQGRIGVGWASVRDAEVPPAPEPGLTLLDVDRAVDRLQATTGSGSVATRNHLLGELFGAATVDEQWFLRRLFIGELRQGALEGVMVDAVAYAAEVPLAVMRRAAMLRGDLPETALVALTEGRSGLEGIGLSVLRPVQPMLAATAADVTSAITEGAGPDGTVSVEWKLDGARIQVHRSGDDVAIYTRNLNDVTSRLPEVVAHVRALPVDDVVLDGEVMGLHDDERPQAFQDTMSRFGTRTIGRTVAEPHSATGLHPFFFDVLHVDGRDLIDEPLGDRLVVLDEVAGPLRIPGIVTADPATAEAFADRALAAGHEGVMVKGLDSPYQAGRRGKAWRKVKPVRLFDLVVLAVEWGSGRRQGWLSNLHLGARDPERGGFVMVGKTFKGLTDALLTWQTEQLLAREVGREGHVVHVRPELVVEIALDGVQASSRYPGGVALRFARVKRYRDDKRPDEADTIDALRALLPR
jgi:DNA ligase-1